MKNLTLDQSILQLKHFYSDVEGGVCWLKTSTLSTENAYLSSLILQLYTGDVLTYLICHADPLT